jgi:histidinol-phosphate aminotransferase
MPIETSLTATDRLARPEVRGLPAYNAGLSSKLVRERYGVDHVARLASNENPFGASPVVARALATLATEVSTYPDASCTALRESIAQHTGISADRIVVGNGSENLLEVICQALLSPGDGVTTVIPSFGLHEIYPRMMGAHVDMVPVTPALEFDVPAICTSLARGPKLLMVSNPSNPVGCTLDTAAFLRLVDAAPAESVLIIDEAYYEYAVGLPDFPDALALLAKQARPWIVLRTFSKAWGLAGLRVGYGLASDAELAGLLNRVRAPFNVNLAAQTAACAALSDPAHMQHSVEQTNARRDAIAARLRAHGLTVAPSAANFLFVDLGRPNGAVTEALLQRGVIVKPWKEPGYERFIRVSIGSDQDNAQFFAALEAVL